MKKNTFELHNSGSAALQIM